MAREPKGFASAQTSFERVVIASEALLDLKRQCIHAARHARSRRRPAAVGYGIEKTQAGGRFEIAGVSREVIEAFSTRRVAIVAAMEQRELGGSDSNPRLAERAALTTRAHKRDVDHGLLREHWREQAAELGFDATALAFQASEKSTGREDASGFALPALDNKTQGVRPTPRGRRSHGWWRTCRNTRRCFPGRTC